MRVLVLSPRVLADFDRRTLDLAFDSGEIEVVGACIDARPSKGLLQRFREELRRGRGGYVLVMAVNRICDHFQATGGVEAEAYFARWNVPTHCTRSLYDAPTLEFIRSRAADSVYRVGFGIIREPILSIAPKGVLSYHHGDMRKYRGQPVAFWELYHGESQMRVTVQILSAGLDCGQIVAEADIPIRRGDSWSALHRRAYESTASLFLQACRFLATPGFVPITLRENELGRLYSSPNLRQYLLLQSRVFMRKLAGLIGLLTRRGPTA